MIDYFERLFHGLADLKARAGNSERAGVVHEVQANKNEQKMRVVIGKGWNGQPMLSPWLNTSDHRGSAREERKYHKGQNVMLSLAAGDIRQATVSPYAENDKHKRPDHAD